MSMCTRQQGFTFIELLIVIEIIGILAAIAIPAYQDYAIRGQTSEGILLTVTTRKAVSDYYGYHGKFPANNAVLALPEPQQIQGHYVQRVEVIDGMIQATYGNQSDPAIAGKTLAFRPEVKSINPLGMVIWYCDGNNPKTTVESKYLPSSCKG